MKHIEDIQLTEYIRVSIYEFKTGFAIDFKDKNGNILYGRILEKKILRENLYKKNGEALTAADLMK